MDFIKDSSVLRNCYWFIRYSRRHAEVRRYYRKAVKEAEKLAKQGYSIELVRLYRLHLADLKSHAREARFLRELVAFSASRPIAFDSGYLLPGARLEEKIR